jgi:hypothetical protein
VFNIINRKKATDTNKPNIHVNREEGVTGERSRNKKKNKKVKAKKPSSAITKENPVDVTKKLSI